MSADFASELPRSVTRRHEGQKVVVQSWLWTTTPWTTVGPAGGAPCYTSGMTTTFAIRPAVRQRTLGIVLAVSAAVAGCARPAPVPELRLAYQHGIVSSDPHAHNDGVTTALLAAVYESLVTQAPGAEVQPSLARSWTTPDDRTWRIALRDGVRFHDNRSLTVGDVIASIERARTSRSSDVATAVVGIESVRAAPDQAGVVEITTAAPLPLLLARLAMVAVVPADFDPARPIGTGPYAWVDGGLAGPIHLRRWDSYWGDAVDFPSIEVTFLGEDEVIAEAVAAGRLDVMARVTSSYLAANPVTSDWRVERIPSAATTFLGLNLSRAPLDDPRVRAAIDLAVDRPALVRRVFRAGTAAPAVGLVPAEVFGFTPGAAPPPADRERARQLLAAAGLKPGTVLRVDQASAINAPLMAALAEDLGSVGLAVEAVEHRYDVYYRRIEEGQNELFLFGWTFRNADASDFLESLVHTRARERFLGGMNGIGYADPDVDRWIEEAAREPRPQARLDLLRRTMAKVAADRPYLPLVHEARLALVRAPFVVAPQTGSWLRPHDIRRADGIGATGGGAR